jgi:SOS-response transcriptional repressor LexA
MMMTLRKKLLEIMEKTGVTQYRISMEGMISPSILHRSFKEGKPFSDNALKAIAKVSELGVSYDQLVRWKLQDEYPENWHNILQSNEEASQIPHTDIPIIGFVKAGVFDWSAELLENEESFQFACWYGNNPAPPKGCVAVKVWGDSMAPQLPNDSILYLQEVASIEENGLYVVQLENNHATVKWVERYGELARLIPYNTSFQSQEVKLSEFKKTWKVIKQEVYFG